MTTTSQKWWISTWSVLLVFAIFNPLTYFITDKLFGMLGAHTIKASNGLFEFSEPTMFGFVLHLVVFFLLVRAMMQFNLPGTKDKDNYNYN
jgi:hypothetical protein